MEFCFENIGIPDVRAMTEMRYRIGMKRTWLWIGFYLITGMITLYNYLQGHGRLFSPLILWGYGIYLAVNPYLQIRKGLKEEAEFHNGKLPENTARFDEKIHIGNTMSSRTWEYDHLVKVYSLKYSYCMRFTDDMVLMVGRANFTKGSFEEFKQFLRQKRPDLEIPD